MLTLRESCRLCGAGLARTLIGFEALPVAGAYVQPGSPGPVFPLNLMQCDSCGLVQLRESIDPEFYSSYRFLSGAATGYLPHLERIADAIHRLEPGAKVLEIGASDGTLLELLRQRGLHAAGFEPAAEPARRARERGLRVIQDFFGESTASQCPFPAADVVVIRHVLEHIDDFDPLFRGLDAVTNPQSTLIVEVPDWGETVRNRIYSNIYHIHTNYFDGKSMSALLAKYGWSICESTIVPVFSGSLYCVARRGKAAGAVNDTEDYRTFLADWSRDIQSTRDFFDRHAAAGIRMAGYGAAERTTSLLGTAGLTALHCAVVYDANPALTGLSLPGSGIPIRHPRDIETDRPDMLAIFARSFEDEIIRQQAEYRASGGRFVTLRKSPPEVLA